MGVVKTENFKLHAFGGYDDEECYTLTFYDRTKDKWVVFEAVLTTSDLKELLELILPETRL